MPAFPDFKIIEPPEHGNRTRALLLKQTEALLKMRQAGSASRRASSVNPSFASANAYRRSLAGLRRQVTETWGWPLNARDLPPPKGRTRTSKAGEIREVPDNPIVCPLDLHCRIYRLRIPVLPGVECHGLLLLPKEKGPYKLVIAQHGGQGTPEATAGLSETGNYHFMSRRIVARGYAVFAPQLLLSWPDQSGPACDQHTLDLAFKQVGGSMAALQVFMLQKALDYLLARPDIAGDEAAMVGLSYGGFYTLALAAVDSRICTAVCSCFLNDRLTYNWQDWTWFDSANRFSDVELCALICPRPLYVEVGKNDELFQASLARPVARAVRETYTKLGFEQNFEFVEFDGTHEFNPQDAPLDFLVRNYPAKDRPPNGNRS